MEGRENGKEVYAVGPGTSEFPLETQDFLWEISSPQVTHNPLHEKFHKEFPKDSVPPRLSVSTPLPERPNDWILLGLSGSGVQPSGWWTPTAEEGNSL